MTKELYVGILVLAQMAKTKGSPLWTVLILMLTVNAAAVINAMFYVLC